MAQRARSKDSTSSRPIKYNAQSGGGAYSTILGYYSKATAQTPSTVLNSSYRVGTSEVMVDVTSPGYFKTLKEGGVFPVNPLTQTKTTVPEPAKVFTKWINPPGSTGYFSAETMELGLSAPTHNPHSINTGALVNEAIANARSKSFDASTFLAEFSDIIRLFTSIKGNLIRYAQKMNTRVAAESWLTYRYGIQPLISDLEKLQSMMGSLEGKYYPRGYAEDYTSSTTTTSWAKPRSSSPLEFRTETTTQTTVRASAMFECSGHNIQFDPVVTAYEMVPFSFIVDWFFSLGAAIAANSPYVSGDLVACSLTVEQTSVKAYKEIRLNVAPYTAHQSVVPPVPSITSTTTTKTRSKASASATVSFSPRITTERILDGISLIRVLAGPR